MNIGERDRLRDWISNRKYANTEDPVVAQVIEKCSKPKKEEEEKNWQEAKKMREKEKEEERKRQEAKSMEFKRKNAPKRKRSKDAGPLMEFH